VIGKKKKNKSDVVLDLESEDAEGSVFTKQWPEIKHVFQSDNLVNYLSNSTPGVVSEKLDGSNLSVTSNRLICSRRNILLNNPSTEQLKKFKFSGVDFSKLVGIFEKVSALKSHIQNYFPFLEIEAILYGELIQKGTATCKDDKFNYRPRGIDQGEFHIFGCGVAFEENLDSYQIVTAIKHLSMKGFSAIANKNELTEKNHLVLLMNECLAIVLQKLGLENIIEYKIMTLKEVVTSFKDKLLKNEIEGIVVNFGNEILKWKGLDESYPDIFIDEINAHKVEEHSSVVDAFLEIAYRARKEREFLKKEKATELLLEKAYKSAMTKMRSVEEHNAESGGELSDEFLVNFQRVLEEEMMKDCHFNADFKKKLKSFIQSKTKC